jgi:hypothetical protein
VSTEISNERIARETILFNWINLIIMPEEHMEAESIKEVVYIETTIISYLVARPSKDSLLAGHQEITRKWWQDRASLYRCVASREVLREASDGEVQMAQKRRAVLESIPTMEISSGMEEMADSLVESGILPAGMRSDALHIAAACEINADYLLTWNCHHLANAHIIRRLEREADAKGWILPTVCTPLALMEG